MLGLPSRPSPEEGTNGKQKDAKHQLFVNTMRGEAFPLASAARPADLVAAWQLNFGLDTGGADKQPAPDMALDIEELSPKGWRGQAAQS